MIHTRREREAVAARNIELLPRLDRDGQPVGIDGDVALKVRLSARQGVVELHKHHAAAAVDDVLGLAVVAVHRQTLPIQNRNQLLRIWGADGSVMQAAVTNRKQHVANLRKIAHAIVGHIPTQHNLLHPARQIAFFAPILQRPIRKGRQRAARLVDQAFCPGNMSFYLRSLHHSLISVTFFIHCIKFFRKPTCRCPKQRIRFLLLGIVVCQIVCRGTLCACLSGGWLDAIREYVTC
ncbi:hypothetical protein SDC9_162489 [bioreactor metagenome]|uniref:Uncharacterized protein n=1 Tax=bioreactor metagenome TaxID=1076179 RepID=A0A645FMI8_9ZZZZ